MKIQKLIVCTSVIVLMASGLACGLTASSGAAQAPTGAPGSATPVPTEAAPAPTGAALTEPSAWQQVMDQIGPEGTVSAGTALQAFSLAIGPLPGVVVPAGPDTAIRSGSGPIRWLVGHWDEITDAQRAEAVRLVPELAGMSGAPKSTPRLAASAPETSGAVATVRPPTYYAVLARTLADDIEAETHLHLDLPIFASEGRMVDPRSAAETIILDAQGGKAGAPARCVITIAAVAAALPPMNLEQIVGHEVWHCYEGQIRGLAWYYSWSSPVWLVEGQAEWVGNALRPLSDYSDWGPYILKPEKQLFSRSYDAIGFYAHLMQSSINTWDMLIPMLQADDNNVARYEASGATSDEFLDTWASGYFRQPAVGSAWDLAGPGLPAGQAPAPAVLNAANGSSALFASPSYANSIYKLSSSADIVEFAVEGHARLGDPGFKQEYVLAGSSFCTKAGGCTCPAGTEFAGPPPNRLSADTLLAVTGGQTGAHGTVTGHALEEYCRGGANWSLVFWSPELGDKAPPVMAAYTCDGLVSTWKVIHFPGGAALEETFDLPFNLGLTVHREFHYDIPPDKESPAHKLDYALDFTLDPNANPAVISVTGTKTMSAGGNSQALTPRDFGSAEPLALKNVSLETQLAPYPKYQHPFRAQALAECGQ